MDYVLLDIKKFLKKLESGQLEIEAGQWELHKDLTNMKFAIGEIKNIKEDVEKMRLTSVQQMNLIRALQDKIETFKQSRAEDRPLTVSERSVKYEKVYKRPNDKLTSPKGYKKRKSHLIRSEEIIEIASQMSNQKSEPDREESTSEAEGSTLKGSEAGGNRINSVNGSAESLCRKVSQTAPLKDKSNVSYSSRNEILQRYLKDSAKFVDKKRSNTAELSYVDSNQNSSEKPVEYTPFWDEYGSKSRNGYQNAATKENSSETLKGSDSLKPKRLTCPKCPRKFAYKTDFLRHEWEHQKAEAVRSCKICGKSFFGKHRLKEHEAIHKVSSKGSKGFKCSYCSKICSTPETLTSHLRKCRIIKRNHFKRK